MNTLLRPRAIQVIRHFVVASAAIARLHGQDLAQNFTMVRHDEPVQGPVKPNLFMKAGDFDRDGKPDLLVAPDDLLFLRGKGDGTFYPAVTVQAAAGLDAGTPMADFDGDGNLDLIRKDTLFLGNGGGGFRALPVSNLVASIAPSFVPPNRGTNQVNAVTADFNEDGKSDLAGSNSSSYEVLLSNGDGSFRAGFSIPEVSKYTAAFAADINRDGHMDLILQASRITQNPTEFEIFLGDGLGSFKKTTSVRFALASIYTLLADFNGDQIPDFLVFPFGTPTLCVILSNADGTFQNPSSLGLSSVPIAAGDYNSDGFPDLVTSNARTNDLLLGEGNGAFGPPIRLSPAGITVQGDWNGDGRSDLAVYNSGVLSILLNKVLAPGEMTFSDAESSADGTPRVAPGSLASLFGSGYSTKIAGASVPSKTLGDIQLSVRDASGQAYLADLLYVSPHQINFRVPEATAVGSATIEVLSISDAAAKATAVGRAQVEASAPSVFSCGPGTNTLIATAEADNGYPEPTDICGDVRFSFPARITFYGTGFVGATRENTRVSVLGESVEPLYVGPAGAVPGLDRIVVRVESGTDDGDGYASWVSIAVDGRVVAAGYTPIY